MGDRQTKHFFLSNIVSIDKQIQKSIARPAVRCEAPTYWSGVDGDQPLTMTRHTSELYIIHD